MKDLLPLFALGLGTYFLTKKKSATTSSSSTVEKTSKNYEKSEAELIPETVNKKKNENNIYEYYSLDGRKYLDEIPSIYSDLTKELQFVYKQAFWRYSDGHINDPKFNKSYIYLVPQFAISVWDLANFIIDRDIKNGKISKDIIDYNDISNIITFEILNTISPDVWWKNGIEPYTLDSTFVYVWKSVKFLVKVAFVNYMLKNFDDDKWSALDKWALPLSIES